MSTRLQVIVDEADLTRLRRVARREGLTVSAWVRRVLRDAARRSPRGDVSRKLAAIRAAAEHSFPAPDIHVMLDEIERGRAADAP
jgi:hypothetical protein